MQIDLTKKRDVGIIMCLAIVFAAWMIFSTPYAPSIPPFVPYLLLLWTVAVVLIVFRTIRQLVRGTSLDRPRTSSAEALPATTSLQSVKAWFAIGILYVVIISVTTPLEYGWPPPTLGWGDIIVRYLVPVVLFLMTWIALHKQSFRLHISGYIRTVWGLTGLVVLYFLVMIAYALYRAT